MAAPASSTPARGIDALLRRVLQMGGSDLHLTSGSVPLVRIDGHLRRLTEFERLLSDDIHGLLGEILKAHQLERLERETELDFGHGVPGLGRFRVNVFRQRGSIGAVIRVIPGEIVPLDDLALPPAVAGIAELDAGFVVVAGPAGSGKSTTVAALLDRINATRSVHIVTLEDPIEFLHRHRTGIVNQRGVGEDTPTFAEGLHRLLRQDADIVYVSDVREVGVLQLVLSLAEAGRLVFTCVTAASVSSALTRLAELAPSDGRPALRQQLAGGLAAVVAQQLVPRANRLGRVACAEVVLATPAVRRLVREDRLDQLAAAIYGEPGSGMQTIEQALAMRVAYGEISVEAALEAADRPDDLQQILVAMQQRAAS